jgi:hypothetical protein
MNRLAAGFDKLVVTVDEIFECEGGRVVALGYYHGIENARTNVSYSAVRASVRKRRIVGHDPNDVVA